MSLYTHGVLAAAQRLKTATDGAALSRPFPIGALKKTSVVAHRSGANTFPENSLGGFRAAIAAGARCVETDVLLIADGTPVLMHDTNTLRTTGVNKTVLSYTRAEWDALKLTPTAFMGAAGYAQEAAPTLAQFFDLCAGRVAMTVEAKSAASVPAIIAAAQAAGVDKSSLVIMSFSAADLAPVQASGYGALFLVGNLDSVDIPAVKAAGIEYIGYGNDNAAAPTKIAEASASGIYCFRWTINRRAAMDVALSNGASGAITDDPEYLNAAAQIAHRDAFSNKRWMPGMLPTSGSNRGVFFDDGSWGFSAAAPESYVGCLMGWACPLPTTHSIVFDLRYDGVLYGSRWCAVMTGANADHVYTDTANDLASGYHCLFRQNGLMQIFKKGSLAGPVYLNGFQCATVFPLGSYVTVRVDLSPTHITMTRLDTGESITHADTAHRGGYFHIGRNGAAMRIKNLSVTKA